MNHRFEIDYQLSERDNGRYDSQENGGGETEEELGTPVPLGPFLWVFVFGLACGSALTLGVLFVTHQ